MESPRDTDTNVDSSSEPALAWELAASADSSTEADVQSWGRSRSRGHELSRTTVPGALREECVPFIYTMMGELFSIHRREDVVFSRHLSFRGFEFLLLFPLQHDE